MRRKFITSLFVLGAMVAGTFTGGVLANMEVAQAASQAAINRYIVSNAGVPPCTYEDGSGQKATCVWWAGKRGNGKGDSYLVTPKGEFIYITGPKAKRY